MGQRDTFHEASHHPTHLTRIVQLLPFGRHHHHDANDNKMTTTNITGPVLARVEYDYEARESGELSLEAGRIITILDSSDQAWWKGDSNGAIGIFPSNVGERPNIGKGGGGGKERERAIEQNA